MAQRGGVALPARLKPHPFATVSLPPKVSTGGRDERGWRDRSSEPLSGSQPCHEPSGPDRLGSLRIHREVVRDRAASAPRGGDPSPSGDGPAQKQPGATPCRAGSSPGQTHEISVAGPSLMNDDVPSRWRGENHVHRKPG